MVTLRILVRIVAHLTFNMFSLRRRTKLWFQIRIQRKHIRFEVLQDFPVDKSKVAILAIFPRPGLELSIERQVRLFLKNGVHVVCVVNESRFKNYLIETLKQFKVTILLRPNIGRDFGAYQTGFRFIQTYKQTIQYLYFANDSAYYFNNTTLPILNYSRQENSDWTTIFLNYQYHIHAQSFFLGFSNKVLSNEAFQNFWKTYYPSNERRYVVDKGEVLLSHILLKEGFTPRAYVNAAQVLRMLKREPLTLSEKRSLYGIHFASIKTKDLTFPKREEMRLDLGWFIDNHNATHETGIYLARTLGLPLKLDLVRSGLVSMLEILELKSSCRFLEKEESHLIDAYLRNGSVASRKGLTRLWSRYGLV